MNWPVPALTRAWASASSTGGVERSRGAAVGPSGDHVEPTRQSERPHSIHRAGRGYFVPLRDASARDRHLEQIVNAMMLASEARDDMDSQDSDNAGVDDAASGFMNELATSSRNAYRRLIDEPAFWPTFVDRSPVRFIGELPIASRPYRDLAATSLLIASVRSLGSLRGLRCDATRRVGMASERRSKK